MGIGPVGLGKEIPLGLVAEVQPEEAEVQVEEIGIKLSGQIRGQGAPVGMVELGKLDLLISAGTPGGELIQAVGNIVVLQGRGSGWGRGSETRGSRTWG